MRLDLHGVKHENAVREVDKFIWKCIQNETSQGEIITGNSDQMKEIVIRCLDEHGLKTHPFFNIGGSIIFEL